jgi:hypothetical protein
MISKVDFVGIPSQDAERSRKFYVEILGLRPDDTAESEVWAGETCFAIWEPKRFGMEFAPQKNAHPALTWRMSRRLARSSRQRASSSAVTSSIRASATWRSSPDAGWLNTAAVRPSCGSDRPAFHHRPIQDRPGGGLASACTRSVAKAGSPRTAATPNCRSRTVEGLLRNCSATALITNASRFVSIASAAAETSLQMDT